MTKEFPNDQMTNAPAQAAHLGFGILSSLWFSHSSFEQIAFREDIAPRQV
jgi:hypothetical protein